MPLTYVIDPSRNLVISKASGIVTFEEVVAHQDRLLNDPGFVADFDQLIDCREAEDLAITTHQAQQIARRKLFAPNSRRALVASNPVVFGIGRMLQAYHETSTSPSKPAVFHDISAALRWLDRDDLLTALAG